MEGPSLYLAANQLKPFRGQTVLSVSGNSKIEYVILIRVVILSKSYQVIDFVAYLKGCSDTKDFTSMPVPMDTI